MRVHLINPSDVSFGTAESPHGGCMFSLPQRPQLMGTLC